MICFGRKGLFPASDRTFYTEAQFDAIKTTYQNMGFTDVNIYYDKITVDGKEFDGARFSAKIQGIDFYGVIFTFRKANYLANVTICSLVTNETDTFLGYFDVK